jgi:uncharacterized protein (TIGR00730 family)
MKTICVNCGSSPGARPEYREAARELGAQIASRGMTLVYGGARVGLMGDVADAVLERGGKVIGVVPTSLNDQVGHNGLTELRVVNTMHERKALMFDLSDAFIALPGGLGTLDEIFELLTWAQLGHHAKPCGLLNVCGYYDQLLGFLDHATVQGFIRREHRDMILVDETIAGLLARCEAYRAPATPKWGDTTG